MRWVMHQLHEINQATGTSVAGFLANTLILEEI